MCSVKIWAMVVKARMVRKEWVFTEPYAAQAKFEKENLSVKTAHT